MPSSNSRMPSIDANVSCIKSKPKINTLFCVNHTKSCCEHEFLPLNDGAFTTSNKISKIFVVYDEICRNYQLNVSSISN